MFRSTLSTFAPENPTHPGLVANPDDVRAFLAKVFTYMTLALVISGGVAYWFGHDIGLMSLVSPTGGMTILGWVVMLAPLALVFIMSGMMKRLSGSMLLTVFIAYSALTGASLSLSSWSIRPLPSLPCSSSQPPCSASWRLLATPPRPTSHQVGSLLFIGGRYHHRHGGEHVHEERYHGP